ncbi:PKD domain-containing protein [Pyxidicoccus parkwayensis]|uniref:PKD domain-containing protein n=1 Tax=Pyxidicoccus parkwayensis TaxID=2813578 RepID=A0ABX7PAT5_9BACT|nr:PKD domain-containing protein [Pyxidicoccus parkwaysis]QSQ27523.1 PKD domain-containing protein [Pyxidicoccus parkwaysis]
MASERREGRGRWLFVAGGVLVLAGVALTLPEGGEASPRPTTLGTVAATPRAVEVPAVPVERERVQPAVVDSIPEAATGEALSLALKEERVVLASGAVIQGIDADRPWVCTGERMSLSARVGGAAEPGAVVRWVWPGAETGAELQPGSRLQWRAPKHAGRYFVRFQVCRDLGGRRVGVLAEQVVSIDVRECGTTDADESLRLEVSQRGAGEFVFRAVTPGADKLNAYRWDFGDGTSAVTEEPTASHAYATQGMGAQESRGFTVRLSARDSSGKVRTATAFVQLRGQPPPDEPPLAILDFERARGATGDDGWRSGVTVRVPEGGEVTWGHVERLTVSWDDQVESSTRPWREVITVEEDLERGGFRGHVTVRPSEVSPTVKQVVDTLHGRDVSGREVELSWASYKSEARPPSR